MFCCGLSLGVDRPGQPMAVIEKRMIMKNKMLPFIAIIVFCLVSPARGQEIKSNNQRETPSNEMSPQSANIDPWDPNDGESGGDPWVLDKFAPHPRNEINHGNQ